MRSQTPSPRVTKTATERESAIVRAHELALVIKTIVTSLSRLPDPHERRFIRERAGLSQESVARIVGVGRTTVTLWELGLRTPNLAIALVYATLLTRLKAINGPPRRGPPHL